MFFVKSGDLCSATLRAIFFCPAFKLGSAGVLFRTSSKSSLFFTPAISSNMETKAQGD